MTGPSVRINVQLPQISKIPSAWNLYCISGSGSGSWGGVRDTSHEALPGPHRKYYFLPLSPATAEWEHFIETA